MIVELLLGGAISISGGVGLNKAIRHWKQRHSNLKLSVLDMELIQADVSVAISDIHHHQEQRWWEDFKKHAKETNFHYESDIDNTLSGCPCTECEYKRRRAALIRSEEYHSRHYYSRRRG